MEGRRKFIKTIGAGTAGLLATSSLFANGSSFSNLTTPRFVPKATKLSDSMFETPKIFKGMPIRATFLDEVSWDILCF